MPYAQDNPASFRARARRALADAQLQRALANVPPGFIAKRARALEKLPEYSALRAQAAAIRHRALARIDDLVRRFERNAQAAGIEVHRVADGAAANAAIRAILRKAGAQLVVKGKSMVAEEIGLNAALEEAGIEVVETDLGEYIIQLRREPPSHIVAPAIHLGAQEVDETFAAAHAPRPQSRENDLRRRLVAEARAVLRRKFLAADAGITGANALIADTGGMLLITNEGNGDLCANAPRLHIVIATIDKLVKSTAEALSLARLLTRAATGQPITAYASLYHGPGRAGQQQVHVVLIDATRRRLLRSEFADMLACIRCGACLNHCPVYQLAGGHAYGHVYSGPMGIVLGNALFGLDHVPGLEDACTMCNRCAEVCPVAIPLPHLIRRWRARRAARAETFPARIIHRLHARLVRHPRLWRRAMGGLAALLRLLRARPRLARHLPLLKDWLAAPRTLPTPQPCLERAPAAAPATDLPPLQPACATKASPAPRASPFPQLPAIATRREGLLERFIANAEAAAATVHRCASLQEAFRLAHEVAGAAPLFVEPAAQAALPACRPRQDAAASMALARAEAGVAETGSLLFVRAARAMLPLLLADTLLVLLEEGRILPSAEQALACHAPVLAPSVQPPPLMPPRLAMLMTGPSRTADIEQTLVLGAHGPRTLHVLLLSR